MAAPRSLAPQQHQHHQKRKSAVELLAETKAFYVKSETVLDRKQELPLRVSSGLSQAIAAGGCRLVSSGALGNDTSLHCNPYATTGRAGTRRAVSAGEGLQSTLRRLLEHCDSRENMYSPPCLMSTHERRRGAAEHAAETARALRQQGEHVLTAMSQEGDAHTAGTLSGTSSSGTSGSRARGELRHRPKSLGDARVFFPESVDNMELPEPVGSGSGSPADPQVAISPPAQYAHYAPRYIRSVRTLRTAVHQIQLALSAEHARGRMYQYQQSQVTAGSPQASQMLH
ncbi:Uncharacterized protein OBRU01_17612 [Operophtera brumata]|uniref:Uncharacterized protein n=1 Tax=Operophtera brumata TaxID=104452 RepID=A0A0L7KVD9_OPEBR|nr:Uncharacterized protein OBRU01_17612 [Operophtera brumata]